MQEFSTVARPYAKALFELAVEQQTLQAWSESLKYLAIAVGFSKIIRLINTPLIDESQKTDILFGLCESSDEKLKNFLSLLANNKRLLLLAVIAKQFELLKFQHENSVQATLVSAVELSAEQIEKITEKVRARLQKNIKLLRVIDQSIIGGFIVKAGDFVVDASIRRRLDELAEDIT